MQTYSEQYLSDIKAILDSLRLDALEDIVTALWVTRERKGRLFLIGMGGSAAACSHASGDFRKLCGIEAYSLDSMAELTARANDEGLDSVFSGWLRASNLTSKDALMVLSVGGGGVEVNVSQSLVAALRYAKEAGGAIIGIVGRDGGWTAKVADYTVLVPVVCPKRVTPYTESIQALLLHLIAFHPILQQTQARWESFS